MADPTPYYDLDLPLQPTFQNFDLTKVVPTHGLFMLSPNTWDPQTHSLTRPLSLSSTSSALVRVSHAPPSHRLLVRVYSTCRPDAAEEELVLAQVRRMLRLSETEEWKVREFRERSEEAQVTGFGRVFRSPTLFEDMVKCILFCNCQWPRTLSMARALCDLQLELQSKSSGVPLNETASFTPATPAVNESKRKNKRQKLSKVSVGENADAAVDESGAGSKERAESAPMTDGIQLMENSMTSLASSNEDEIINGSATPYWTPNKVSESAHKTGNFPSPEEIAGLEEKYLAKRCGLGYRAGRILKLAKGIVEGRIQLSELEELSKEASLSNYNVVDEKLKEIEGFGPFTRGNVLMCMGFYNVIPSDSETIRHLQQVHARKTSIQKVKEVVEEIYGEYEPYQFLAYWMEIWNFYEDWFGKLSEMPSSDYGLITASNMRTKKKLIK